MLSPQFASVNICNRKHGGNSTATILADNTYAVISPNPVKVIGFCISGVLSVVAITITVASADGSTIYWTGNLGSNAVFDNVVFNEPFIADKGLAWKSTGAGIFSVFVVGSFFLTEIGS